MDHYPEHHQHHRSIPPKAVSRERHEQLCERMEAIKACGPISEAIVKQLQETSMVSSSTKGLNPFQLNRHVKQMSKAIFGAEQRILADVPSDEWSASERLICIRNAKKLKNLCAEELGCEKFSLEPERFVIELDGLYISGGYTYVAIQRLTAMLSAYQPACMEVIFSALPMPATAATSG